MAKEYILGVESTAHTFGIGVVIKENWLKTERFIYDYILYYNMEINEFLRAIRISGTSLAVNIPPEIIKLLKLKKGDIVKVKLEKAENNHDKQ